MELILNLAWILLALPAYALWQKSRNASERRGFSSWQCLLALVCVLVMLFPVISATDDLHAMRTEMEESSPGKRSVRQGGIDKASAWNIKLQSPPVLLNASALCLAFAIEHESLQSLSLLLAPAAPLRLTLGRAPPSFYFA